jgi:hypothetical protein
LKATTALDRHTGFDISDKQVLETVERIVKGDPAYRIVDDLRHSRRNGPGDRNHSQTEAEAIVCAARAVLRLSSSEEIDSIRGRLINQAEYVFRESMNLPRKDCNAAVKALTLVAKLTGAAEPTKVQVTHSLDYSLEQLSEAQLLQIAEAQDSIATLEQLQTKQLNAKAIDAEFEPLPMKEPIESK